MKIIWKDTDLTKHVIELTDAVNVQIEGVNIEVIEDNEVSGILLRTESSIVVEPLACNVVAVKERK